MIIKCPIYNGAKLHPNAPCVFSDSIWHTYGDIHTLISSTTDMLRSTYTLTPYHPITLQHDNTFILFITFWSLLRLGIPVLIINPKSTPTEKVYLMEKANSIQCLSHELSSILTTISSNTLILDTSITLKITQWAHIVPTSGSSGTPKLAVLSLGNYLAALQGSQDALPVDNDSVWYCSLPLYHVSGMSIFFRSMFHHGAVTLSLESTKTITHMSLVETQLQRLINSHFKLLQQTSYILLGGSALSPSLLSYCNNHHLPIFPTYGMTELASQISTSGSVLPHITLKLKENEIWVKGASLFQGYLTHTHCIIKTDEDGFYNTGDLGYTINNTLVVTGRKDRVFISGGENISPEEIEAALYKCASLSKACVIAVPDKEFQMKGIAFIDPYTSTAVESIKKTLKTYLSSYKIPKEFLALPKEMKESGLKISYASLKRYYLKTNGNIKSVDL